MTVPSSPTHDVTRLLVAWGNGDRAALDRLMPLVYEELRRLARHYMSRERPGHTLQTTALVNEAYLRLVGQEGMRWENRAHFFGIAARLMRQILVDHAKRPAIRRQPQPSTGCSLLWRMRDLSLDGSKTRQLCLRS